MQSRHPKSTQSNQSNIYIYLAIASSLIIYIYISYKSWQYRQISSTIHQRNLYLARLNESFIGSALTSTTNSLTNNDNNQGDIDIWDNDNDNNQLLLEWKQIIQPRSSLEAKLVQYLNRRYLPLMNNKNISARGFDTIDELTKMMSRCCITITRAELNNINKILLQKLNYYTHLASSNPKYQTLTTYLSYYLPKIHLAKSTPGIESNMPHTHATTMMMPNNWWQNPNFSTFMHELAHIHQRSQPADWDRLYIDYWKFKYIDKLDSGKIRGLDSIIARSRMNPDGTNFNWLWMGSTDGRPRWIGAVYPVGREPKLTRVEYVSIPLDTVNDDSKIGWVLPPRYNNGQQLPKIEDDNDFIKFFGVGGNNYHPNELGAQMMEEFIKPSNKAKNSPALDGFSKWLASAFKV